MKSLTNKYVLGAIAAAFIAAFVLGSRAYRPDPQPSAPQPTTTADTAAQLIRDYSPVFGPADAPVTLVEFLDPECESCAAMNPIVKDVLREFSGKVRLVVRYMPFHGNSAYASGLLEGARAHDRYWQLLDEFFVKQPQWASHHAPRPDLLLGYVRGLGLDERSVLETARSAETTRRIQQDRADGIVLGVTGTPTFFVNGRRLASLGHQPLRMAVSQALSGK